MFGSSWVMCTFNCRTFGGRSREYVRAADLLPADVNAQVKAGGLLLRAGQFEDAKARVEKALALDAKNVDAQVLLGNTLAGLKDLDGASRGVSGSPRAEPRKERGVPEHRNLQMVRGRLPEAEAAFRKAVEVAPKSVPVRLALANFFWAAGRRADAEQSLKETLALDPNEPRRQSRVGRVLHGVESARCRRAILPDHCRHRKDR